MFEKKNNPFNISKSDYIRYLYQEVQRKGINSNPNFYNEIIKFVDSEKGQQSFLKFASINPKKLGITIQNSTTQIKRAF